MQIGRTHPKDFRHIVTSSTGCARPGKSFSTLLFALFASFLGVHGFDVIQVTLTNGPLVRIQHPSTTNFYHILLHGDQPGSITRAVAIHGPTNGMVAFARNIEPGAGAQYFRMRRYHVRLPGDQDGDGIHDLFELAHPGVLNPFDARDGRSDPDSDGLDNLEEARRGSDPSKADPGSIVATSPQDQESGVAVTRETVFRLSRPLGPQASLGAGSLTAIAAGRTLLSRADLSSDRRTVTLFYLENLPGDETVTVRFKGDGLRLADDRELDVDGDGTPGGTREISFRTLGIVADASTAVSGVVYDSERIGGTNRPLAGVTITVDGAEESMRAVTDDRGRFTLSPCPPGRFFVHVDGRTARLSSWPEGDYYPFIGKAWNAVPGSRNNLATLTGEIFLPRIRSGTLQRISSAAATTVGFPASVTATNPALAGVTVTVPANALFAANGVRGGRVGIAPVPPDRLPEPLPGGMRFPLVITVQTDGPANFDQPVSVAFPNLPDPTTGKVLPAGAKSALWSFDHDIGRWELQGTMTVSADGRLLVSDAGTGIRQPGWHASAPGSPPAPPPGPEPEEDETPCEGEEDAGDVWDVIIEITKCAANLARAGDVIKGAIEIVDGLGQMVQALYDMYQIGQQTNADLTLILKPLVESVAGQKEIVKGILDAVNAANPAAEVTDAVNCILGLASSGSALACALECRSNDPDCQELAALLASLQTLVDVADLLVTGNFAIEPFCIGLDFLTQILPSPPPPSPSAALPEPETRSGHARPAADPVQILAAILQTRTEAERLLQSVSNQLAFAEMVQQRVPPALERAITRSWRSGIFNGSLVRVTGSDGSVFRSRMGSDAVLPLPIAFEGVTYSVEVYEPVNKQNAACQYIGPVPGTPFDIPTPIPGAVPGSRPPADTDQDGLPDYAESIAGTNSRIADSDDDGTSDNAEILAGTDPLLAENRSLSPVARLDTAGDAQSITLTGSIALVADGPAGLSLVSLTNLNNPVLLGRLETDGFAHSVAAEGSLAAVADGTNGLLVVDISNPAAPTLRHRVLHPNTATTVAVRDGIAYVGLRAAGIAAVDMVSGQIVQRVSTVFPVDEIAFGDRQLFVLTAGELEIRDSIVREMKRLGSHAFPRSIPGIIGSVPSRSLHVDPPFVYAGYLLGYQVLDISNPAAPRVVGTPPIAQATIHDLKRAAGNILLTVTSFSGPTSLALTTYDDSVPTDTTRFIATRPMGEPLRSLAEYRGHAVLANGTSGVQVTRFFLPEVDDEVLVAFSMAFPKTVPSGRILRLKPEFPGNRRISHVELVEDEKVVAVANDWPFELVWNVPPVSTDRTASFFLRVHGFGGLVSTGSVSQVTITAPQTGPTLLDVLPAPGSAVTVLNSVTVSFLEPLDPAATQPARVSLRYIGRDLIPNSADDILYTPTAVRTLQGARRLNIEFSGALPAGEYELALDPALLVTADGRRALDPVKIRYTRHQPTPTITWTSQADGLWSNPSNWSGNRVPGTNDAVFIDLPDASPTVTLKSDAGPIVVASLVCRERFHLDGGNFTVSGGYQSEISGEVVTSGSATFRAEKNALLSLPGKTGGGGTFIAGVGGRFIPNPSTGFIDLPNLAILPVGTSIQLDARPESRINAPQLNTANGSTISLVAEGGAINLDALGASVSNRFTIRASAGGIIALPSVRTLHGTASRDSFMTTETGGNIELPQLESVSACRIFFNDAESPSNLPSLSQVSEVEVNSSGGVREFAMSSASNSVFVAKQGATLTLTRLTHISAGGNSSYQASEASRIEFPVLKSVNGPFSGIFVAGLVFRANSGSRIHMPLLEQPPAGRVLFTADGSNSVVLVPILRQLDGPASGSAGNLDAFSGGRLEFPSLTRLQGMISSARTGGSIVWNNQSVTVTRAEIIADPTGTIHSGSILLATNGVLSGTGSISVPVVNDGIVRPGGLTTPGTLTFAGGYSQGIHGRMEISLTGTSAAQRDTVVVNGSANLSGTLSVLRGSALTFASGQEFEILKFRNRVGDFTSKTGLTQGAVTLQSSYSETSLTLRAP